MSPYSLHDFSPMELTGRFSIQIDAAHAHAPWTPGGPTEMNFSAVNAAAAYSPMDNCLSCREVPL
jgi:hypothetical protein